MWPTRGIIPPTLFLCLSAALAGCASGADAESSFAARLELIPASVVGERDGVVVAMADLDRAAELAGVTRPEDTSDADAVLEYGKAVTGVRDLDAKGPAPVAALTPNSASAEYLLQMDEFAKEVGWSFVDISWFAEFQDPPTTFMVAGGEFDEKRLSQAMGKPDDGIWRLGGEDGKFDRESISPARPLGQPVRLALDDGHLLESRKTPPLEDALGGGGDTLADNDVLRALAEAMDGEEVYSAYFNATGLHQLDPVHVLEKRAIPGDQVLPQPFRGVAGGLTQEGGKPVVVFAYVHGSDSAAEANAEALRTLVETGRMLRGNAAWSKLFTVDEVRADGSTLVARLGLGDRGNPQFAYNLMTNREGLVSHR